MALSTLAAVEKTSAEKPSYPCAKLNVFYLFTVYLIPGTLYLIPRIPVKAPPNRLTAAAAFHSRRAGTRYMNDTAA